MADRDYRYWKCCVDFSPTQYAALEALIDMIDDAITINRETFLKHVSTEDRQALEEGLGYALHNSQGLMCATDYSVSYHRSKFKGERVYFMKQSAIEYIFKR